MLWQNYASTKINTTCVMVILVKAFLTFELQMYIVNYPICNNIKLMLKPKNDRI